MGHGSSREAIIRDRLFGFASLCAALTETEMSYEPTSGQTTRTFCESKFMGSSLWQQEVACHYGSGYLRDPLRVADMIEVALRDAADEATKPLIKALRAALSALKHARDVNPGEDGEDDRSEWLDAVDNVAHGFETEARAALAAVKERKEDKP